MMVGPIPQIASKIDMNIPADAKAANQVRTRMANGTLRFIAAPVCIADRKSSQTIGGSSSPLLDAKNMAAKPHL